MKQAVYEEVIEMIRDILDNPAVEVCAAHELVKLGVNRAILVQRLEDLYNVDLLDSEYCAIHTVKDVIKAFELNTGVPAVERTYTIL